MDQTLTTASMTNLIIVIVNSFTVVIFLWKWGNFQLLHTDDTLWYYELFSVTDH